MPNNSGVLEEFKGIFDTGMGKRRGPPIRVEVDTSAILRFCKAKQVPYALRPKMKEKLENLVRQGTFEFVRHSSWATLIVPTLKKNRELQICGDYKSTVLKAAEW